MLGRTSCISPSPLGVANPLSTTTFPRVPSRYVWMVGWCVCVCVFARRPRRMFSLSVSTHSTHTVPSLPSRLHYTTSVPHHSPRVVPTHRTATAHYFADQIPAERVDYVIGGVRYVKHTNATSLRTASQMQAEMLAREKAGLTSLRDPYMSYMGSAGWATVHGGNGGAAGSAGGYDPSNVVPVTMEEGNAQLLGGGEWYQNPVANGTPARRMPSRSFDVHSLEPQPSRRFNEHKEEVIDEADLEMEWTPPSLAEAEDFAKNHQVRDMNSTPPFQKMSVCASTTGRHCFLTGCGR